MVSLRPYKWQLYFCQSGEWLTEYYDEANQADERFTDLFERDDVSEVILSEAYYQAVARRVKGDS